MLQKKALEELTVKLDAASLYKIGLQHYEGDGVKKDDTFAEKWFTLAAEKGYALAQNIMGNISRDNSNNEATQKWWTKSAAQGNKEAKAALYALLENADADEQYNIGRKYYDGSGMNKDYESAVKWFCRAADKGSVKAQSALGECYYNGLGTAQNYEAAAKYYTLAAVSGYAEAQTALGECYASGMGVPKDSGKAIQWWMKAAGQGDAQAQAALGYCYYGGYGVAQSYKKAFEWFLKAAAQGLAEAQYGLADCYLVGKGVDKDSDMAIFWLTKAAEQGGARGAGCTCILVS